MNPSTLTQLSPASYKLLDGVWPVLDNFPQVPSHVIDRITSDASGTAITNNLQYLSIGLFLIDTDLLKPHLTQRPVDQDHVVELKDSFQSNGILRTESPGVVIGLGEGWLQMRNSSPQLYRITKTSPHLNLLAAQPGGPIAHVIRGGHRTEAIRSFAMHPDNGIPEENFWYYNVLAPGLFFLDHTFSLAHLSLSSHQHPSLCHSSQLFLYRQHS